jgi:hypothetical protein
LSRLRISAATCHIDEKDDGGDWDFDARFPEGKDIAWRLPTAK